MTENAKSFKDAFAPKDTATDLTGRVQAIEAKLAEKAKMADILTETEKATMLVATQILEGLGGQENQVGMVGLLEKAFNIQPKVMRSTQGVSRGE